MSYGTLTIVTPDGGTRTAPIDQPQLRIGRNSDNDVVIDDPSVSGYHARIFAGSGGLSILDVGSRNGTEVDGRAIASRTPLTPASRIRIGAATISVAAPGAVTPIDDFVLPPFTDPVAPGVTSTTTVASAPVSGVATVTTPPARAEGPPLVRLDLQPPVAKADISAGGPVVLSFVATIQNLSRFVDRIDLDLDGPPWLTTAIDPPFHNLKPGDTAQSRVELSVPRSYAASAGEHQVELVAHSQKRPELRFAAATTLAVTPFTDFRFELLEPRARTAWTGGRFRAQVTNNSNRAVVYNLEGLNTDGALIFRFDPDPVEIKPGERRESAVRARFKLLRLFGQPKTFDFTLTGEPLDQSAPLQQAQGRIIQRPPLPPWMLITGAVLSLLALLLACSSLLMRNRDSLAALYRGLFALPSPTAVVAITPLATPDAQGTAEALKDTFAETQVAVNQALAASAQVAGQAGGATQQAQASAAAGTQVALQTAGAGTQTAAAIQVTGTAVALSTRVAGTATAFASQVAGTATAQANATGTAVAGTLTALALTATPTTGTPVTPTFTATPVSSGASAGQTITFDRLRGIPVSQRVPIRGDEYAGQDAFFCFYQPESSLGSLGGAFFTVAQQVAPPLIVSVQDVSQSEGSAGGTTSFVFTVSGSVPATSGFSGTIVLEYRTFDGGALPDGVAPASGATDYLPQTGTITLQFSAPITPVPGPDQVGSTAQASFTIPVIADTEFEGAEGFTVSLSRPDGGALDGRAQALGIIGNDDVASPTPTSTATSTPIPEPTATPDPDPEPPPAGDAFDCQPPQPAGTSLRLLRAVIYPPPVTAANSAPLHSLTTDAGANELLSRSIAVVNFQRNIAEVNVDVWYPGGEAAAYVMFAFDERGALIATARRDAIGVPAAYQLNIRSLERPVRQIVIEARREFSGDFGDGYRFAPVVPPLLTRVDFRYTSP